MPRTDDEIDDLLQRAMKTLDDQVPSGYFEALPNRTLMRLEDSSMATTGTPGSDQTTTGVPPERDEDSGLHDIRNLASSTRMRMSSRRISEQPHVDDDILASSSAGWKAVALPEPAKMISLPSLDEERPPAAAKPAKASRRSKPSVAEGSEVAELPRPAVAPVEAPRHVDQASPVAAKDSAATPMIGARLATPRKSKKGVVLGVAGLGLAAAAAFAIYVKTGGSDAIEQRATSSSDTASAPAGAAAPATDERAKAAAPAPPAAQTAAIATDSTGADQGAVGGGAPAEGAAAPSTGAAVAEPDDNESTRTRRGASLKVSKGKAVAKDAPDTKTEEAADKTVDAKKPADVAKKDTTKADGEPDFDALLKEAGVKEKQPDKPKLDKTSLSGTDFKNGMNAIRAKAQACYAGTQGTASVKLTVAPSGQVTKVTVSGAFAGTSVAACVEAAVKSATFPPWDGGPQSFGYSYLLSE